MKIISFARVIILAILLVAVLVAIPSCDTARGGAAVYLEDVSIGAMSMEGKPIAGLPSGKADIVLKVSANKINIRSTGNETIITLSPSGATIISGPEGLSITGVKPEQIEMKWKAAE